MIAVYFLEIYLVGWWTMLRLQSVLRATSASICVRLHCYLFHILYVVWAVFTFV